MKTKTVKFGRLVQFDERSRGYPIRSILRGEPRKPRSYTWRCTEYLDQKAEGACVGFSIAHELIARPAEVTGITAVQARAIYKRAQKLDQWPGENYEGTSVLAGMKAMQELHPGKVGEYRWAFGLSDVLRTVSYYGPVVLGIPWYEGMTSPTADGVIRATGQVLGGHAILCNGVSVKTNMVRLHNSWGVDWGKGGDCFLSFKDLEKLLYEDGEACVPEKRIK